MNHRFLQQKLLANNPLYLPSRIQTAGHAFRVLRETAGTSAAFCFGRNEATQKVKPPAHFLHAACANRLP